MHVHSRHATAAPLKSHVVSVSNSLWVCNTITLGACTALTEGLWPGQHATSSFDTLQRHQCKRRCTLNKEASCCVVRQKASSLSRRQSDACLTSCCHLCSKCIQFVGWYCFGQKLPPSLEVPVNRVQPKKCTLMPYNESLLSLHRPKRRLCLLQWKGLPYAECTWETPEAISEAGGQAQLDQYEASHCLHPLCQLYGVVSSAQELSSTSGQQIIRLHCQRNRRKTHLDSNLESKQLSACLKDA